MDAAELGDFLRRRRQSLEPADVGLFPGANRRTPGLRREEVSVLAGIGVSWLTRLEQGRAKSVSAQVLDSLGEALRLGEAERSHLFDLAGVHLPAVPPVTGSRERLRQLVDGLDPSPAYVLDAEWNLVVWNRAEESLFPLLADAGSSPNLLRLFLEREQLRTYVDDWPAEVERLTWQFRAHVTRHPSERLSALVGALSEEHRIFREAWELHNVAPLAPKIRVINHAEGPLRFDQHRLAIPDHPGWQLVLFLPLASGSAPT
ncbi:MAG: helix-turn-helix transcriptional regulator [Acidimicrobiales bacterium]